MVDGEMVNIFSFTISQLTISYSSFFESTEGKVVSEMVGRWDEMVREERDERRRNDQNQEDEEDQSKK